MFKARYECIICNSNHNAISIYEINFTDEKLVFFFKNYYKSVNLSLLENYVYEILYCKLCDFYWQKYLPSDILCFDLYENWIDSELSKSKAKLAIKEYSARVKSQLTSLIKFRKKQNQPIALLDYGAGWGGWSLLAADLGVNVNALEISPKRISYLKECSIPVITSLLPTKNYELIILNQVLEHVVDIKSLLIRLGLSCNDKSFLIVSVPNCRNIKQLIYNEKFIIGKNQLHPMEHLNGFTNRSLTSLLFKFGFEKISLFQGILINLSHFDKLLFKRVTFYS